MRINEDNKTMDMEARDMNYILPAYVRSYQFHSKGETPEKIIFPMFPSVMINGKDVPIDYVPYLDPVAVDIIKDGSNVPEVTEEQEAALDEKDEKDKEIKDEIEKLEKGVTPDPLDILRQQEETALAAEEEAEEQGVDATSEAAKVDQPESPARAAFKTDPDPAHQPKPEREPKQPPGGDIGPGAGPSDMQGRDRRDQARTAADLRDEPDIEGAAEKEFEKDIKRDGKGNPIVEDKPDAPSGQ